MTDDWWLYLLLFMVLLVAIGAGWYARGLWDEDE